MTQRKERNMDTMIEPCEAAGMADGFELPF